MSQRYAVLVPVKTLSLAKSRLRPRRRPTSAPS